LYSAWRFENPCSINQCAVCVVSTKTSPEALRQRLFLEFRQQALGALPSPRYSGCETMQASSAQPASGNG
jgi:hypothetical protein